MRLARARGAEDQDIGPLLDPGIALRERRDVGFADGGRRGEVKGLERLAGGQPRLGEIAGDPACGPLGEFVLAQGREEVGRTPTPHGRRARPSPARGGRWWAS